jgi:hypothetical protein
MLTQKALAAGTSAGSPDFAPAARVHDGREPVLVDARPFFELTATGGGEGGGRVAAAAETLQEHSNRRAVGAAGYAPLFVYIYIYTFIYEKERQRKSVCV